MKSSDWELVLSRERRPPEQQQEAGGKTLRIARTFSSDISAREQQMAISLVLLWQKKQDEDIGDFAGVFWLAVTCMAILSFADGGDLSAGHLPEFPESWNGEETLSRIVALLRHDEKQQFLLAGCHSCAADSGRELPAGESAVLWRIRADGPVVMTRGEVFLPPPMRRLRMSVRAH